MGGGKSKPKDSIDAKVITILPKERSGPIKNIELEDANDLSIACKSLPNIIQSTAAIAETQAAKRSHNLSNAGRKELAVSSWEFQSVHVEHSQEEPEQEQLSDSSFDEYGEDFKDKNRVHNEKKKKNTKDKREAMVLIHEKMQGIENEENKASEELTDNSKLPALNMPKFKIGINQFEYNLVEEENFNILGLKRPIKHKHIK